MTIAREEAIKMVMNLREKYLAGNGDRSPGRRLSKGIIRSVEGGKNISGTRRNSSKGRF